MATGVPPWGSVVVGGGTGVGAGVMGGGGGLSQVINRPINCKDLLLPKP